MEEKDINVNNMMFGYKMLETTHSRLLKTMISPNPELHVQDSNGCCGLQSTSFDRKRFCWKNWTPCCNAEKKINRQASFRKDFNKSIRKPSS